MVDRALKVCDPHYLDKEIDHIRNTFRKLCYPPHFIENAISKAKRKFYIPTESKITKYEKFITLPYHEKLNSVKIS